MRFCFARLANCSFPLLFFIENGNAVLLVVDEIEEDLCFLATQRSYCLHACQNNPKFGLALRLWGEETANKNKQNHPKPLHELYSARSQNSHPKYVLKAPFFYLTTLFGITGTCWLILDCK